MSCSVLHAGMLTMDKIIHDENLKLFHKRVAETTDEKQRPILNSLFAEHNAKYCEWQRGSQPNRQKSRLLADI
jgi:hypothetical protein